jgi:putative tributyrin esterase
MKKYRTIEISDPKYESDHLRFITVKTDNLKGRGDIVVFVPPDIDPGRVYPVITLLHGVYGSAWAWALKGGVHRQVLEMIGQGVIPPVIIAMPSDGLWGDGSAYLPHNHLNFEKWIAGDVPNILLECIDGVKSDSPHFISGLSMGGFGSLRIGVKYRAKYKAVSAHSAITNVKQMKLFVEENLENYHQKNVVDDDVLLTILQNREHLPPIYFDCGISDNLLEYNRMLHSELKKKNIPHSYKEFPGGHDWTYWTTHIKESLLFFSGHLY